VLPVLVAAVADHAQQEEVVADVPPQGAPVGVCPGKPLVYQGLHVPQGPLGEYE